MILAIDLGTGSVKTVAVDDDGATAAFAEGDYAVVAPEVGWSETDPEAWWQALVHAVRTLPEAIRRQATAIGLSGQMHSLVLCSGAGAPVRPAVLWSDTRSEFILADFESLSGAQRRRLGNPIVTGMTEPSLLWLARHEPESLARARWALQPKDWLRLRMTGVAATDPSDASATLLYDLEGDRRRRTSCARWGCPPNSCRPCGLRTPEGERWPRKMPTPSVSGQASPLPIGAGDTPPPPLAPASSTRARRSSAWERAPRSWS